MVCKHIFSSGADIWLHFYEFIYIYGRETPNGFSGCSVPACRTSFPPHFLRIVVEMRSSGPPHILWLWLGVGKGMLPVRCFCSNKSSFRSWHCHKVDVSLATLSFGDIAGFKTVVFVCLRREYLYRFSGFNVLAFQSYFLCHTS